MTLSPQEVFLIGLLFHLGGVLPWTAVRRLLTTTSCTERPGGEHGALSGRKAGGAIQAWVGGPRATNTGLESSTAALHPGPALRYEGEAEQPQLRLAAVGPQLGSAAGGAPFCNCFLRVPAARGLNLTAPYLVLQEEVREPSLLPPWTLPRSLRPRSVTHAARLQQNFPAIPACFTHLSGGR